MDKLISSVCLSFFVLLLPCVKAEELTVMTEDWAPYNYMSGDNLTGYSTDIVRAIMDELGVEHDIYMMPGIRAERYTQTKANHVFFTLFRTPKRENLYKWVGPIATEEVYFFKTKDSDFIINNADDIKKQNLEIVVKHEGMIRNEIMKQGFENVIDDPRTNDNALLMLIKGRGDLFALTPVGVKYLLGLLELPADALQRTPVKLFQNDLYIVFSPKTDDAIVNKWQATLEKVKKSSRYQGIKQKYIGGL